ncbi:glycosyltransferase family 4 protein [Polaribacter sp. BAL334]|uniref:glycosyltransferase family 4 protein n=1 Tax=Polaribacter sp. BAL334 TaxID=1708178 RepID=UPI0018D24B6E|nr:glycosyltransferase family 4 protein [Polaribacter sp. BAL334]
MKKRILVIATSRKTRGGITSVIKAHSTQSYWKEWNCKWLETHIDKNIFYKLWYFIKSFTKFLFIVPFYDIIHIHLSEVQSLKRKTFYFLICRLLKKRIIIHFHAFSPETTINSKYKWLYKSVFNTSNCIIVLSDLWKKWVIEYLDLKESKIFVIYNPCPKVNLSQEIKKENIILFAGTINERKGYSTLISAFANVANKYPDWSLFFAGNGEIEKAKILVDKFNISSQVKFLGWIKDNEKESIFNKASIFCLPSYNEGFPMAVLDAWAYGIPTISTPVGGMPDIGIHSENCLFFKPGNIDELTECIVKLINDENLRIKLRKESINLSNTIFNQEIIGNKISQLYASL